VANFHHIISGFVIRQELKEGLESLLAPDALNMANEYLAQWKRNVANGGMKPEDYESWILDAEQQVAVGGRLDWSVFKVTTGGITRESWRAPDLSIDNYPSLEGATAFEGTLTLGNLGYERVEIHLQSFSDGSIDVRVEAPEDRIEELRDRLIPFMESFADPDLAPVAPTFKVFIAHGGDPAWTVLHRVLNDIHGIRAEAFESEERAGYTTLSVVEQMVATSTVAIIVMTGEDRDEHGSLRARENVIHELGFCQGALGIANTIVVLENGVSEPSNIRGLTQVRFDRGNILGVEERIVRILQERQQLQDYQLS